MKFHAAITCGCFRPLIMANIKEHTLESELERYISEIISVLQQGGENGRDFVHFRLDYLCVIDAIVPSKGTRSFGLFALHKRKRIVMGQ